MAFLVMIIIVVFCACSVLMSYEKIGSRIIVAVSCAITPLFCGFRELV